MDERTFAEFIIDKAFQLYDILITFAGSIDNTVGESLGLDPDQFGDLGIFQPLYDSILGITFFDFVVLEIVLFMIVILLKHFLK